MATPTVPAENLTELDMQTSYLQREKNQLREKLNLKNCCAPSIKVNWDPRGLELSVLTTCIMVIMLNCIEPTSSSPLVLSLSVLKISPRKSGWDLKGSFLDSFLFLKPLRSLPAIAESQLVMFVSSLSYTSPVHCS